MAAQFENNRDISYVNLRCLCAPIFQRVCTISRYFREIPYRELFGEFISPYKNLTRFKKNTIHAGIFGRSIARAVFAFFYLPAMNDPDVSSN